MTTKSLYLLAGNGGCADWWRDVVIALADFDAVPIELPGSGDNPSNDFGSLDALADALITMTSSGSFVVAVGINALVVLRAQVRRPGHFARIVLYGPVGPFLWRRRFVSAMRLPGVRAFAHAILRHKPEWVSHKWSLARWPKAQYDRIAAGYRKSRAFSAYFDIIRAKDALDLTEWIDAEIDLIWGSDDRVLQIEQLAAWDTILARASLCVIVKPGWSHYPFIEAPQAFAAFLQMRLQLPSPQRNGADVIDAHTKAGRCSLAAIAGLPVPQSMALRRADVIEARLAGLDARGDSFAVRSSNSTEDKVDQSNAGRFHTFLRVSRGDVAARVSALFEQGIDQVLVQPFIEPLYSGVAFVRGIGAEIEMVKGHLESLVQGTATPIRFVISRLGDAWQAQPASVSDPQAPSPAQLVAFLQRCIAAFHYTASDIEWAWDGRTFWMLQLRPVTTYRWRRLLTTANIDEILPRRPSVLMEHAQRHVALTVPRAYAAWDPRVLEDAEPFTALVDDASYINSDLFLSRFHDWGLPSSLYANEIGGVVPKQAFRPLVFLRSIPVLLRMQWFCRRALLGLPMQLQAYEHELTAIRMRLQSDPAVAPELIQWWVRFYQFIVQANFYITAALASGPGTWLGAQRTVYADVNPTDFPHRVTFESDPASPRNSDDEKPLQAFPEWGRWLTVWHLLGLPGMRGRFLDVREWFRDQHTRLIHRLHNTVHQAGLADTWFQPHAAWRQLQGTFWQDGGVAEAQAYSFVIHPGAAEGVVGQDILIVDALDPGQFEKYKKAAAVIARMGGRLSHGATLLREIRKPSAIVAGCNLDGALDGKRVRYANGVIEPVTHQAQSAQSLRQPPAP